VPQRVRPDIGGQRLGELLDVLGRAVGGNNLVEATLDQRWRKGVGGFPVKQQREDAVAPPQGRKDLNLLGDPPRRSGTR
jgi:hypothetical protein